MGEPAYALVAYLPGRLGQFVDELRKRLNPRFANWQAHVTVLPPRPLPGRPEEKVALLEQKCTSVEPFEAAIDGVSTFWPVNGVVYLSFSRGLQQLVQLHNALNTSELAYTEPYGYVPHVTIAQELAEAATRKVLQDVSQEWSHYQGDAFFRVDSLCLVQQTAQNQWINLAPIPLGSVSVFARK